MRVIFVVIGVGAIVGGLYLLNTDMRSDADFARGLCTGSALVLAGLALCIAAARNYRGHWSFVIGVALLMFGFLGLGSEIDDARAGELKDAWAGVFLIVLCSALGGLSLWSGHKLHRCLLELDRDAKRSGSADTEE